MPPALHSFEQGEGNTYGETFVPCNEKDDSRVIYIGLYVYVGFNLTVNRARCRAEIERWRMGCCVAIWAGMIKEEKWGRESVLSGPRSDKSVSVLE
jgi:hypothetical protein